MVITETPHRISFFGGGTDYPAYYMEHGGKVLGGAIDKFCYLSVRLLPGFFEHKHRIVYSASELVSEIDDIKHPSVRETMRKLKVEYGLSIHHDADIPARSGMGSSSAFTVGLIKSILAREGRMIGKSELTDMAIDIEQNWIKEAVGSQDQAFAAHGGFNRIEFLPSGKIVVDPVIMDRERFKQFESNLVLVFTGFSRIAAEVAAVKIQNIPKRLEVLHNMKNLVDEAFEILVNPTKDLDEFGKLLNYTWEQKKKLAANISNASVDEIYNKAMKAGAIGGKLLGAGNGGFMLLYVRPEQQQKVISSLGLLHIPFKFDFSGSRVIVYHPDF